jgi:hypothetical protein
MNHNLKKIVRRVLRESLTESEPLWYRLPNNILNELGIELYNPDDEAYVVEIHFDTKNVLIQLYTDEFNELVPYWNSNQIPGNIKDNFDNEPSIGNEELIKAIQQVENCDDTDELFCLSQHKDSRVKRAVISHPLCSGEHMTAMMNDSPKVIKMLRDLGYKV